MLTPIASGAETLAHSLPSSQKPESDPGLREACQEFEAVFLGLMLRQMWATVPRNGVLTLGTAGEVFESLWMEELARCGARTSPLGLARLVAESLTPEQVRPARPQPAHHRPSLKLQAGPAEN
jgi:flagellar protein FlgJ